MDSRKSTVTVTGDHDRSSDEIKENITETRHKMDDTLDRLATRVDPRGFFDDAKEFFTGKGDGDVRGTLRSAAKAVSRPVRDNPLAALALAASTVWFIASSVGDDDEDDEDYANPRLDRYGDHLYGPGGRGGSDSGSSRARAIAGEAGEAVGADGGDGLVEKAKDAAQAAKETLGDAADAVKDAAGTAKESIVGAFDHTKESIGKRADSARGSLTGGYEKLQRRSRRAATHAQDVLAHTSERMNDVLDTTKQRYQACLRENPLAMVLGALGIGIVSAALAPVSRKEDEWFGEASDKVTDQLKEEGEKLVEKGKHVGERVANAALEEAESTDSPTEILSEAVEQANEKVRSVVSHVGDEAMSAAKDEGLTVKSAEELVKEKLGSEKSESKSESESESGSKT